MCLTDSFQIPFHINNIIFSITLGTTSQLTICFAFFHNKSFTTRSIFTHQICVTLGLCVSFKFSSDLLIARCWFWCNATWWIWTRSDQWISFSDLLADSNKYDRPIRIRMRLPTTTDKWQPGGGWLTHARLSASIIVLGARSFVADYWVMIGTIGSIGIYINYKLIGEAHTERRVFWCGWKYKNN